MVSKCSRYSQQSKYSLVWDSKPLTLLRQLEQPVFLFVNNAITIKQAMFAEQ